MNKAYSRINWQNAPSEATALNETNLNKMDSAIDTIDDRVVAHDTRLDNAEYALTTAQGDITTLQGTVGTQGSAITALQNGKVDKETGKGLSTNDYTTTEKEKLATIQPYAQAVSYSPNYQTGELLGTLTMTNPSGTQTSTIRMPKPVNYLDSDSEQAVQNKVIKSALDGKVDKVSGKGLCDKSEVSVELPSGTPVGEEIATVVLKGQDGSDATVYPIYNGVTVDSDVSATSENPLQNKAIYDLLNNLLPEKTASGNPISISDASGLNTKSAKVTMLPIQDLHGQSAPYPAGGGKNLAKPYSFSLGIVSYDGNGNCTISGTKESGISYLPSVSTAVENGYYFILPAGTYKPSTEKPLVSGLAIHVVSTDNDTLSTGSAFTITEEKEVFVRIVIGAGTYNWTSGLMLEAGSQATDYAPYSNICPISGRNGVVLTRTGKNLFDINGITQVSGATCTENADGSMTVKSPQYTNIYPEWILTGKLKAYTYTFTNLGEKAIYVQIGSSSDYSRNVTSGNSVTFSYNGRDYLRILSTRLDMNTSTIYKNQLELGSTATTYEPYNGQTHTATFPSTVYGGEYEFVSGDGSNTWKLIDLGNLTYTYDSTTQRFLTSISDMKSAQSARSLRLYCSIYEDKHNLETFDINWNYVIYNAGGVNIQIHNHDYTDPTAFKTAMSGVQLCYELATPTTTQLTPETIALLKGENVITTDGDNAEVKYSVSLDSLLPT